MERSGRRRPARFVSPNGGERRSAGDDNSRTRLRFSRNRLDSHRNETATATAASNSSDPLFRRGRADSRGRRQADAASFAVGMGGGGGREGGKRGEEGGREGRRRHRREGDGKGGRSASLPRDLRRAGGAMAYVRNDALLWAPLRRSQQPSRARSRSDNGDDDHNGGDDTNGDDIGGDNTTSAALKGTTDAATMTPSSRCSVGEPQRLREIIAMLQVRHPLITEMR